MMHAVAGRSHRPFEERASMSEPLPPERCAELFGALAAPERQRIVQCLREGPLNVSDLADRLDIALVNVSHHLSVLRHAGLLRSRKQGRHVLYSLEPKLWQLVEASSGGCCDHLNLDLGCCRIEWLPLELPSKPDPAEGE
jgi:ArsR family transcriptional regulator